MSKKKKPPFEKRLAERCGRSLEGVPAERRKTIRMVLVAVGGLVAIVFGLACAVAGALFMMGMARGVTADQAQTAIVSGVVCAVFGALCWAGGLMNRVGRLLGR